MIDTHCHLADKKLLGDIASILNRAKEAGVDKCIAISDDLEESAKCVEIAEKYEQVFCTIGVHPHNAKEWDDETEVRLKEIAGSCTKVVAIGEIGLDYYYDHSPRDVQKTVFLAQLRLAKELKLPAVVHCREAIDDLKKIINEVNSSNLVIHCCTEKWEDVQDLVKQGYLLSFTGISTYPKSEEIQNTIKQCPVSQIMIETDAPYLAPVPHRGKINEPAYVAEVAKCIAKLKGIPLKEVDKVTTANAVEFFGL